MLPRPYMLPVKKVLHNAYYSRYFSSDILIKFIKQLFSFLRFFRLFNLINIDKRLLTNAKMKNIFPSTLTALESNLFSKYCKI